MKNNSLIDKSNNNTLIRNASVADFYATEFLTREAFWNLYLSGADEHLVLHNLRKSNAYLPYLDLVAIHNGEIIGHCITTIAHVVNESDSAEVLCLGPISVSPELQNSGIGSLLINESIRIAKELAYPAIILYGDPNYYNRFGFINAEKYGITTKDGKNFDPFMALELNDNALTNIQGRFIEAEAFITNEDELNEFDAAFPIKVKTEPKIIINL